MSWFIGSYFCLRWKQTLEISVSGFLAEKRLLYGDFLFSWDVYVVEQFGQSSLPDLHFLSIIAPGLLCLSLISQPLELLFVPLTEWLRSFSCDLFI